MSDASLVPVAEPRSIYRRIQPWISLLGCVGGLVSLGSTAIAGTPGPVAGLFLLAIGLAARLPLQRFSAFAGGFLLWSLVWFGFTTLRGFGDDLGPAARTANVVPDVERWLFGGQLPSARLQGWFYDPANLGWFDKAMAAVYGSFFAVSSIVAIIAMSKNRAFFRTHVRVLATLLAIGCIAFAILPTNPPWMAADPAAGETIDRGGYHAMERFRESVLGAPPEGEEALITDTNPLAAMPSIHLAGTTLLFFLARRFGRRPWQVLTALYTVAMGFALIYLGEHYLLDVVAGYGLTALSWRLVADGVRFSPLAKLRRPVPATSAVAIPAPRNSLANVEDRAA